MMNLQQESGSQGMAIIVTITVASYKYFVRQ